jgi:rubrerythrin
MTRAPACDRGWIAGELSKAIEAEASRAARHESQAESPPDPGLAALYHEMAEAGCRHRDALELVAIRYGHTPARSAPGAIRGIIDKVKTAIGDSTSDASERVAADLSEAAGAVHRYTAWAQALKALGDEQGACELTKIIDEESGHCGRLQEALNRLIREAAERVPEDAPPG